MNTRMAVPIASAASFWARVGDDMRGPPPFRVGAAGRADVGGELGGQRREGLVRIGAVGARTISDDGRMVRPSRAMRLLASASRPSCG